MLHNDVPAATVLLPASRTTAPKPARVNVNRSGLRVSALFTTV